MSDIFAFEEMVKSTNTSTVDKNTFQVNFDFVIKITPLYSHQFIIFRISRKKISSTLIVIP